METRRWFNQSQPQTMQIAVFLLYANAVFALILGSDSDQVIFFALVKLGLGPFGLMDQLITIAFAVACAVAAYLIANERKAGHRLGVVAAAVPVAARVLLMITPFMNGVPRLGLASMSLISLMFDVALLALLLHTQTRSYERIWFK